MRSPLFSSKIIANIESAVPRREQTEYVVDHQLPQHLSLLYHHFERRFGRQLDAMQTVHVLLHRAMKCPLRRVVFAEIVADRHHGIDPLPFPGFTVKMIERRGLKPDHIPSPFEGQTGRRRVDDLNVVLDEEQLVDGAEITNVAEAQQRVTRPPDGRRGDDLDVGR